MLCASFQECFTRQKEHGSLALSCLDSVLSSNQDKTPAGMFFSLCLHICFAAGVFALTHRVVGRIRCPPQGQLLHIFLSNNSWQDEVLKAARHTHPLNPGFTDLLIVTSPPSPSSSPLPHPLGKDISPPFLAWELWCCSHRLAFTPAAWLRCLAFTPAPHLTESYVMPSDG